MVVIHAGEKKMKERGSGILLHVISLHTAHGIGDLGPSAYGFADFLVKTKQRYWQVLPLNPTDRARGNIPYSSASAFAGNPLLISPELLVREGLLEEKEISGPADFPPGRIDYDRVIAYKTALFNLAFSRFKANAEYERFCSENAHWLDDYALFTALKCHFGGKPWYEWPAEISSRQPGPMNGLKLELKEKINEEKFLQFYFFRQWRALRETCNRQGIRIIGDIPIYVDYDSVDVWMNPRLFKLDENARPLFMAGVPPDYFSETGQLWGNPVYDWDALKASRYDWWIKRFERIFSLYDMLRVDHFRGLVAYWEIPAGEKTAVNGRWVRVPTEDFFDTLRAHFKEFPIIAEDLGVITPDVKETRDRYGFPGMKVLVFAFGGDMPSNPYIPHNHIENCIIYPGTHDNNTIKGWFEAEASQEEKQHLFQYLGREVSAHEVNWEIIRLAMASVAHIAVFSIQDVLGLGQEARMNTPATVEGNYCWRLTDGQLSDELAGRLLAMTQTYGRALPAPSGCD
jgi:4-alpha-glucanotransferase